MRYDKVKQLSSEEFRRLTGVLPGTFEKMLEILNKKQSENKQNQKWKGGRKTVLSTPDMLLVTLEYLREYRTMFHIAQSYGVDESSCWRAQHFVEDTLVKDGTFSLPGRKELLRSDVEYTSLESRFWRAACLSLRFSNPHVRLVRLRFCDARFAHLPRQNRDSREV